MNLSNIFNEYLDRNLPFINSFHPFFNDALQVMLKAGGKHFRAQLLLGVVANKNKDLLYSALDVALALEFMHTYSLIHDDLPCMDNADLRRGELTLHKKYDETTAILVGDALNTQAFFVLANAKLKDSVKIKLINTLSFNAGINGMIIGQAIDCYFENKKLNLDELKFLHIHKTARLIAASLKMGCEICELDEKQSELIYKLGIKLGLIFQINDDIIDKTLDENQSGKTTNNDENKNSFVNLLGLDEAKKAKNELLQECEREFLNIDESLALMIKDLIKKYL